MSRCKHIPPMTEAEQKQVVEWLPIIRKVANQQARFRHRPQIAEDYFSIGVLAAINVLRRFGHPYKVKITSYLWRQIVYAIADYERSERSKMGPHVSLDEALVPPARPVPSNINFDEMVDGLDERSRLILRRKFLQGYNQREIGRELHLAPPTISQNLKTALRKVRTRLLESAA